MDARVVTVLSIEADKAVADFVCASLERTSTQNQNLPSFEVVRATRLSDGLSHLDGASFDVVLAELDLPDSCPEETLARLREHTPDLPIVILTERLDVELARRMVRAGVSDYLFKHELNGPLLAHALASVVEREPPTPEDAARTGHDTPVACESCHARIFESLPDPAILWRRRQGGEIVMAAVNPAARALTDEKIDVYLGQPLESVFSHDPNAVEMVRSTFDEGEVRRGEGSYHVRTTGEDKWFLADAIRLTEDVVLNVARDTTAWRASEDALRRAEREKALVLGTVSDMVAYYESPDLRIAWANQAAARSVGFTMEALQGRHCYEVWHAREEPCEECPVLAAFRTGVLQESEVKTPDGRVWNLRAHPHVNGGGQVVGVVEWGQDITERRRVEEALRRGKEVAALAQRAARLTSWDWDVNTDQIRWIGHTSSLFGLSSDELSGPYATFLEFVHPEDRRRVFQALRACLEGRGDCRVEHRIVRSDGSVRWVAEMGDVIRDPEGKPLRLLGMAQDITERKEAELERERYAQDLVRSNRELEQFARLVSHDLRAPLRTVIGFLRLLEEERGEGLDDEAREYVTYASESAARMQRMIEAMLEYARLEGEIEPFGPVDCEALLAQTLHDLRFVIDEWEGVVTSDPLPVVWGDSVQLSLVFQNLVSNALKFQREGHTPRVHVSVEKDEEEWLFSVEDNGIGISERHQKRLFQVFSRLHTPQEYPGLGVGLATCKKVVDRHGGRIWVESEPGVGSTFYFSIPLEGTQTQL